MSSYTFSNSVWWSLWLLDFPQRSVTNILNLYRFSRQYNISLFWLYLLKVAYVWVIFHVLIFCLCQLPIIFQKRLFFFVRILCSIQMAALCDMGCIYFLLFVLFLILHFCVPYSSVTFSYTQMYKPCSLRLLDFIFYLEFHASQLLKTLPMFSSSCFIGLFLYTYIFDKFKFYFM